MHIFKWSVFYRANSIYNIRNSVIENINRFNIYHILQSNDKLELTNQLQSEQYTNQDVRTRFSSLESDYKALKEKLFFKDEEMIRLTHVNAELRTTVAKLTEQIHHHNHNRKNRGHSATLNGMATGDVPANENDATIDGTNEPVEHTACGNRGDVDHDQYNDHDHNHDHDHDHDHDQNHDHDHDHGHDHHHHDDHDHAHGANIKPIESKHTNCSHHTNHVDRTACNPTTGDGTDTSDTISVTSTINIATNEAMDKLQKRFTRTMSEIAELTEEKHRLEHLVTQLQNETETIGEYIALYQTQRRLLKQREIEKDVQLHRIAADREAMKGRLEDLNKLVELLLVQEGFPDAKHLMDSLRSTNKPDEPETHLSDAPVNADSIAGHIQSADGSGGPIEKAPRSETQATANKIINLLTEIKDKNLSNDLTAINLNHCSCCSGKLEVV